MSNPSTLARDEDSKVIMVLVYACGCSRVLSREKASRQHCPRHGLPVRCVRVAGEPVPVQVDDEQYRGCPD